MRKLKGNVRQLCRLASTTHVKGPRKLTGTISKTGCCCIFINQLREKIGVMFGNPETTTGGNALSFTLRCARHPSPTQIKDGDAVQGNRTKVKISRTRFPSAARNSTSCMERAFPSEKSLTSAWTTGSSRKAVPGSRTATPLGQGRDAVKALIEDNPELMEELEAKIVEAMAPPRLKPRGEAAELA